MIEQFSPMTRKVLAVGILILVVLAGITLVVEPILSATTVSLSRLADARFRLDRLQALEAQPAPQPTDPVPADMVITASNRDTAIESMTAAVAAAAAHAELANGNLAVSAARGFPVTSLTVQVSATGREEAVLRFINDVERGRPVIRFKTWRLARNEASPVTLQFEAIAVAVWEARP